MWSSLNRGREAQIAQVLRLLLSGEPDHLQCSGGRQRRNTWKEARSLRTSGKSRLLKASVLNREAGEGVMGRKDGHNLKSNVSPKSPPVPPFGDTEPRPLHSSRTKKEKGIALSAVGGQRIFSMKQTNLLVQKRDIRLSTTKE